MSAINLETTSSVTIPTIECVMRGEDRVSLRAMYPRNTARNFQVAVPSRSALHLLPSLEVQGVYTDESGAVQTYGAGDVKVSLTCRKTPGLEALLELQARCYGEIASLLAQHRPQPATELQWQSTPFIVDLGSDYVRLFVKFPPAMAVRVLDATDLSADATSCALFQCASGSRFVGAFQITGPWAMEKRAGRDGAKQAPLFGMSAKSVSATGGATPEERERGMVTAIVNVEDPDGPPAGASADDAGQPHPPKRRRGVQSDLGDL